MDKLKFFLVFFLIWVFFIHERTVTYGEGVVAPAEPIQKKSTATPFLFKQHYTVTPLADFSIEARILAKERYRFDQSAELSPIDLVLGWGKMSDEAVLAEIDISQGNRWYYWQTDTFPVSRHEIETHSANMHLIPQNDEIEDKLLKLHVGEIVKISGYLVKIDGHDGMYWQSSLSRSDTGAHACEVVFVKEVEVKER